MTNTQNAADAQSSKSWIDWFTDLQKSETFLGGVARSAKARSPSSRKAVSSADSEDSAVGFVWDSRCTEKTIECLNKGATLTCLKAFSLCSGVEAVIDPSTLLDRITSTTEGTVSLTKSAIQALSIKSFNILNLPPLPQIENVQCQALSWKSLVAIGGSWLILPHIINIVSEKKDQKNPETLLAKSVGKGLLIGPFMAWTFNQDLYTGAVAGILSAWAIDTVASYTLTPISTFFNAILEKDHIAKTFERQLKILKYGGTIAALSICYAHVGSLVPFLDNSPYKSANLPISITLATGTFIFVLKYPINLLEGIFTSTKDAIKTIGGSPEIPIIAYSSLLLTLYKEKILNFASENFTYENCLSFYNNTSLDLLDLWNRKSNLAPKEKAVIALFSSGILGILSIPFLYKNFQHTSSRLVINTDINTETKEASTSISPEKFELRDESSAFSPIQKTPKTRLDPDRQTLIKRHTPYEEQTFNEGL
jgi:hypothetical protein